MLRLGLGSVDRFPFLNPPDRRLVRDGYKLLHELDAVDERNRLTIRIGWQGEREIPKGKRIKVRSG